MGKKSYGAKFEDKWIKQRLQIVIKKWRVFEARIPVQYESNIKAYMHVPLKFSAWRKRKKTWLFLPVVFDLVTGVLPVPKCYDLAETRDFKRIMLRRASDSVQYGNRSRRAYWHQTLPNSQQRSERKRLCRNWVTNDLEPDDDG